MSGYSGMTVNERLFASELIGEWEQAVRVKNREKLIELLRRVELADQAGDILDSILGGNPRPNPKL